MLKILYGVFSLIRILAGLDKYFEKYFILLTDWGKYIKPIEVYIPFSPHTFMMIVGEIEMIDSIIVHFIPRGEAYFVALGLLLDCFSFNMVGIL